MWGGGGLGGGEIWNKKENGNRSLFDIELDPRSHKIFKRKNGK
jgi:hypothetical protein